MNHPRPHPLGRLRRFLLPGPGWPDRSAVVRDVLLTLGSYLLIVAELHALSMLGVDAWSTGVGQAPETWVAAVLMYFFFLDFLKETTLSPEDYVEVEVGRTRDELDMLLPLFPLDPGPAEFEESADAGVRAIVESDPEIEVVAEAMDGREAVELTLAHRPDVVLLDIRMPRMDGLAATAELRRVAPEARVVILTTFGEDEYISQALGDGASGFLLKAGDPRELIAGVHAVADGGAYLSPQVARQVISRIGSGGAAGEAAATERLTELTYREREVLALVGTGLSNADIAGRLFLVEGTVKSYVSAILNRLGLKNRVQAAILAYEAGLVERAADR